MFKNIYMQYLMLFLFCPSIQIVTMQNNDEPDIEIIKSQPLRLRAPSFTVFSPQGNAGEKVYIIESNKKNDNNTEFPCGEIIVVPLHPKKKHHQPFIWVQRKDGPSSTGNN